MNNLHAHLNGKGRHEVAKLSDFCLDLKPLIIQVSLQRRLALSRLLITFNGYYRSSHTVNNEILTSSRSEQYCVLSYEKLSLHFMYVLQLAVLFEVPVGFIYISYYVLFSFRLMQLKCTDHCFL